MKLPKLRKIMIFNKSIDAIVGAQKRWSSIVHDEQNDTNCKEVGS